MSRLLRILNSLELLRMFYKLFDASLIRQMTMMPTVTMQMVSITNVQILQFSQILFRADPDLLPSCMKQKERKYHDTMQCWTTKHFYRYWLSANTDCQ